MKQTYTTAVVELLQSGQDIDAVLTGLQKAMQRRGHLVHYAAVLEGVVAALQATQRSEQAEVAVAADADVALCKDAIAAQLATLHAPATYRTVVRPELVGGSRVMYKHTVSDASYKTALLNLYQRVVRTST